MRGHIWCEGGHNQLVWSRSSRFRRSVGCISVLAGIGVRGEALGKDTWGWEEG
ncbi:hypothetical protein [Pajaroellobacter abortibovis]|nr:hypothetical protein [Pajaroellobacter abortibovis]